MGAIRPSFRAVALVALVAGLFSGCGTSAPVAPNKAMQYQMHPVRVPPSGQTLVNVHRPRAIPGHDLHSRIWQGTNLVAILGNGQSLAWVCPPGRQYFVNLSPETASVVEANLLPDQTYDLWVKAVGSSIPSFELKPLRPGVAEREQLANWSVENVWVAPRAALKAEPESIARTEAVLREFTQGSNQQRLERLGPQDHR